MRFGLLPVRTRVGGLLRASGEKPEWLGSMPDAGHLAASPGARAGRLIVMAGGEVESQKFRLYGPQGAGITKLGNQVIYSCTKVVLSGMLMLARGRWVSGRTLRCCRWIAMSRRGLAQARPAA